MNMIKDLNTLIQKDIKIAIVCMTKNPISFEDWLLHHFNNIGVVHIFLRVEDTPELHNIIDDIRWKRKISVSYDSGERDYIQQMERQKRFVNETITISEKMGHTHIIHIDDDELLYLPRGRDALLKFLNKTKDTFFKIKNLEAIYDKEECNSPFRNVNKFLVDASEFTSYTNGKGMACTKADIICMGPHDFKLQSNIHEKAFVIDDSILIVLHYESPCIAKWKSKFYSYKTRNQDDLSKIPFKFYREAIYDNSNTTWSKYKLYNLNEHKNIVHIKPFLCTTG